MKRPAQEFEIRAVWPLFTWRRCLGCGMEFRRELGWFVRHCNSRPLGRYICKTCAPCPDDAIRIFLQRIEL